MQLSKASLVMPNSYPCDGREFGLLQTRMRSYPVRPDIRLFVLSFL